MPLNINQPAANALFSIDATPRMPTISCQARITGIQPDPTENTPFDWSIQITETVRASSCQSSLVGTCTLTVGQQSVVGGRWAPTFNSINGGDAVITVRARVQDAVLQSTVNVRIRGTNPAAARITAALGGAGTAADRIGCHESGRRQFDGTGMPLLGPGGDVGVMQLCNPAASCTQRWDWTANVAAGAALIAQKETAARRHLNQHIVQSHYLNNQNFGDADVLLRETIQRYNGGAFWVWDVQHGHWRAAPPNNYVVGVLACR